MAHYNLGDWKSGLKAVRDTPNVYPSTGGSGLAAGYVEADVREGSAERLIFGCRRDELLIISAPLLRALAVANSVRRDRHTGREARDQQDRLQQRPELIGPRKV
jgi:hypothetical protein